MRKTGPVTQQEYLLNADCTLVSTTDLKSRITYCNPAFLEASGYSMDELVGQPHNLIRHPDMPQEAFRDLWDTVQGGLPWSGLVKNRRKNGDHYWVQANVTPTLIDGRVSGYVSVRTCPSREAVRSAEALYARLRQEAESGRRHTSLHQGQVQQGGLWSRLRGALQWGLRGRLTAAVMVLALAGMALAPLGGLWPPLVVLGLGMGVAAWLRQQATAPLAETLGIANRLAAGDVGQTIRDDRTDEAGLLKRALAQLKVNLQALVGDVREQVDGIQVASQQISAGSSDLSARTETQAANLQQSAASLEQISGNVQANSRSAEQANQLAERAQRMANDSAEAVGTAMRRMADIEAASHRIAAITQVVDALSFQTNLLALNAAVEAARAGEAGRGFAVVAAEVRNLAGRTQEASAEIKALVARSVAQVGEGTRSVEATGRSVEETRQSIEQVSALVGEISVASREQADGVEQVHKAVSELDSLTQQNAAMVEQLSAAAASLSAQAGVVASAVKIFRT